MISVRKMYLLLLLLLSAFIKRTFADATNAGTAYPCNKHNHNNHILTFTKVATYSASAVKSNCDNFLRGGGYTPGLSMLLTSTTWSWGRQAPRHVSSQCVPPSGGRSPARPSNQSLTCTDSTSCLPSTEQQQQFIALPLVLSRRQYTQLSRLCTMPPSPAAFLRRRTTYYD